MSKNSRPAMRGRRALTLVALFAISLPSAAVTAAIHRAQQPATPTVEAGKYKLHVFEVPAGEETYEIVRQNESLLLTSTFEYSDRGTVIALKTSLRTRSDLTPERFAIKGKTPLGSDVDLSVDVTQRTAQITDRARARQATVPDHFFVNSGAFPISTTAMLFRYWIARNIKTALRTIPDGAVTIEHRGQDTIDVGGKRTPLERYALSGLIWGREFFWADQARQVVAVITYAPTLEPIQAIREGYESALPTFLAKAAEEGMADLARSASRLGSSPPTFAIVGGNLIDGTGAPAVGDAVIVVQADRIVAAGPRETTPIARNTPRRPSVRGSLS